MAYSAKKDRRAAIRREIEEEREIREYARKLLQDEHYKPEGHVPGTRADLCRFCQLIRGTPKYASRKTRAALRKKR